MRRRSEGFTLIELMIVIAIIAIIAAISVPAFLDYLKSSKTSEGVNHLKVLGASSKAYYQNNAAPAFSLQDLDVDDALKNGEKGGYDWVYFPSSADPEHFVIEGYPASPYAGHVNFYMSQNGVIRYSEDGRADETSPILQKITLEPDFQNPPPMGVPDCWYGPYTPSDPPRVPTPTTLESQAAANAALHALPFSVLREFADTLPSSFASAVDLADGLWPVTPQGDTTLTILGALDTDGDHAFHIDEILPAPAGDFYAGDTVPEVQAALGGCLATCNAGNQSAVDCNAACSDTLGNPGDATTLLDAYVAELAGLLELGVACDQSPDALAFFDLENDPTSLLAELAFLAGALVPSLARPLLGLLALVLLAIGALGFGRRG